MADKSFEIGDLVWAKMKGYAPWPSKIENPPEDGKTPTKLKKHQYYVFFFGSKNYAWIASEDITRHSEEMVRVANMKKKNAQMQSAIDEILLLSRRCSDEESQNVEPDNGMTSLKQFIHNRKRTAYAENVSLKKKQRMMPKNNCPYLERKKKRKVSLSRKHFNQHHIDIEGDCNSEEQAKGTSTDEQTEDPSTDEHTEEHGSEKRIHEIDSENYLESETGSNSSSETPVNTGPSGSSPYTNATMSLHAEELARAYMECPPSVSELKPVKHDSYSRFMARYESQPLPSRNLAAIVKTIPPAIEKRPVVYVERPSIPELDSKTVSDIVKNKKAVHPVQKIGFIGLGTVGRGIVKSLLSTGHDVMVWNRTEARCLPFVAAGIQRAKSPAELVIASDVIFSCLKDAAVVKHVMFGREGVIKGFDRSESGKVYVEMTAIDVETSEDLSEAIKLRGGRYLEANFYGTGEMAEKGELLLSVAGEEDLYREFESCFEAMSKVKHYTGTKLGSSSVNMLALTMLEGSLCATFAEVLMAMKEFNISQSEFYKVVKLSPFSCELLKEAGEAILSQDFTTKLSVSRALNSTKLALRMGKTSHFSNIVGAAVRGLFSRAEGMNYGGHDISSVYMVYDQYEHPDDVCEEQATSSPETITIEDD